MTDFRYASKKFLDKNLLFKKKYGKIKYKNINREERIIMQFIDSWIARDKGLSKVIIKYKGKIYIGSATCHPEDHFSEFTGCRYAEMRAEIMALKTEYKQKKHDCEECRKFVRAVSQYAQFDPKSPSARAMYRQLNRRIKEVNKIAEEIGRKEFNLQLAIRQQGNFNAKCKSKVDNKS